MLGVASAPRQYESATGIPMSQPLTPLATSLSTPPPRRSRSADLGFRVSCGNSHWPPTVHAAMCTFQRSSLRSLLLLLPPLCPWVCSLCLRRRCCPGGRFTSTVFLDCIYSILLSLKSRMWSWEGRDQFWAGHEWVGRNAERRRGAQPPPFSLSLCFPHTSVGAFSHLKISLESDSSACGYVDVLPNGCDCRSKSRILVSHGWPLWKSI